MRQPEYRDPIFSRLRWSWTMVLIVVNLIIFVVMQIETAYNVPALIKTYEYGALSNEGLAHGYVWQFITFQFMHAGRWHFAGNMLGLFFLGRIVENSIGPKRFILLYLSCGIIGGVFQTVLGLIFPNVFGIPVVGASAGVFGLLAALATLEPEAEMLVFFILPVKTKYLAWISAVVALFYVIVPAEPGMAHAAHLGGLAMGWFFVRKILYGDWTRLTGMLRRPEKQEKPLRRPRTESLEPKDDTDFLQSQVDLILDKISAHGIGSLTTREREILESARKKMTKP